MLNHIPDPLSGMVLTLPKAIERFVERWCRGRVVLVTPGPLADIDVLTLRVRPQYTIAAFPHDYGNVNKLLCDHMVRPCRRGQDLQTGPRSDCMRNAIGKITIDNGQWTIDNGQQRRA